VNGQKWYEPFPIVTVRIISNRAEKDMPIYEYTCQDCGSEFELLIRGSEKPVCPSCGRQRLTKSLSVPAAHTAGSREPQCPARGACGMDRCPSDGCGAWPG